jgi:hypothetical protein
LTPPGRPPCLPSPARGRRCATRCSRPRSGAGRGARGRAPCGRRGGRAPRRAPGPTPFR